MADLLGSILGSMEKPPSMGDEERKKARERKKQLEKIQQQEKENLQNFKAKILKLVNDFIKDNAAQNYQLKPMDKVYRAIVHEVSDIAGLASFSFGDEEVDRYVMLWKKEFAPTDDELEAHRKGEKWDPEKAKELAKQKALQKKISEEPSASVNIVPQGDYREKYERLIGKESAREAAHATLANRSYGFVTSENKRDRRTIEEVMAENKARKKMKTQSEDSQTETSGDQPQCEQTNRSNHDREEEH